MQPGQGLCQRGRILQAQVHSLPRQRVYGMGRITNQRPARATELLTETRLERNRHARPQHLTLAQAKIEGMGQRLVELEIRQRQQRLGLLRRARPDNGALMRIGQRQKGQNVVTAKNLSGGLLVGLAGRHRRHQRAVIIIPLNHARLQLFTQPGAGAIGSHQQTTGNGSTVVEQHKGALLAHRYRGGTRRHMQADMRTLTGPGQQTLLQQHVFYNMPQV